MQEQDHHATWAALRAAAAQSLAAWPEADAAVLFGSRARGTHHAGSDWDVAFLVPNGQGIDLPEAAIAPLARAAPNVECGAFDSELAAAEAVTVGTMGRAIARDGKLLAGRWQKPPAKGSLTMLESAYHKLLMDSILLVKYAGACIGDIGRDYEDIDGDAAFCARAISASADAAERLAKGMLCRLKVDYDFTHDLAELAGQARSQGHRKEAQAIASLNGQTKRDHTKSYRDSPPSPRACAHAADRLARTVNLLRDEVASHAHRTLPAEKAERLRAAINDHFSLARGHLENAAQRSHAEDESASSRASVDAMVSGVEDVIDAIDAAIGKRPDQEGAPPPP